MQIVLNAQTGITSGTVAFSMVQLESGAVATPFEQRPIGTELALCQRYYQKFESTATNAFQYHWFRVTLRTNAPAVTLTNSVTSDTANENGVRTNRASYPGDFSATISAEL